ncbi:hypothetical protein [Psychrosphaera algicola]|uniref:Uncharacterized protein n=1 Tax=Psychrosphaera algicola TaxID=3023714 RepID=A0ABT5FB27_9GAMM|nr:hypothetical protein [Psychrosphaera sp. G1-22]MDC2888751.1 hypothetical protein [Psychrosphaera sp. G1-22]
MQNNTSAEFKIIEKANIQLPLELQDSLEQNEIIAYSVGVNSYYVKALNQKK